MFRIASLAFLVACTSETPLDTTAALDPGPSIEVPEPATADPEVASVDKTAPVVVSAPIEVATAAIAAVDAQPVAEFALAYGETLDDYARWSGQPVEKIAEASGLKLHGGYKVGTVVKVPVADDAAAKKLTETRQAATEKRVSRWVQRHRGTGSNVQHTVRTGETAWGISEDSSVPIWVISAYNPGVNLDRLKPGQLLAMPELKPAEVVVEQVEEPGEEPIVKPVADTATPTEQAAVFQE